MKKFWTLTVIFDIVVMVVMLMFTGIFSYPWLFDLVWIFLTTVFMGIVLKLEKRFSVILLIACFMGNLMVLLTTATIMMDISILIYSYMGFSSKINFLFLLFANIVSFGWLGMLCGKKSTDAGNVTNEIEK